MTPPDVNPHYRGGGFMTNDPLMIRATAVVEMHPKYKVRTVGFRTFRPLRKVRVRQ